MFVHATGCQGHDYSPVVLQLIAVFPVASKSVTRRRFNTIKHGVPVVCRKGELAGIACLCVSLRLLASLGPCVSL